MNNPRASKYRKLAIAEHDRQRADLLFKIADEADKGILCIAEWKKTVRLEEPAKGLKADHPARAGE